MFKEKDRREEGNILAGRRAGFSGKLSFSSAEGDAGKDREGDAKKKKKKKKKKKQEKKKKKGKKREEKKKKHQKKKKKGGEKRDICKSFSFPERGGTPSIGRDTHQSERGIREKEKRSGRKRDFPPKERHIFWERDYRRKDESL